MAPQTDVKSEKDQYVETLETESQRTLKLLREFPQGKEDFKPAEISRTARELVWILAMEEQVVSRLMDGDLSSMEQPKAPNVSWPEIVKEYEKIHGEHVQKVRAAPANAFEQTRKFPVGKGQLADMKIGQIAWFMLMDHIHHRGQFSVYLRMVGARVPAIYGPSADEPWR